MLNLNDDMDDLIRQAADEYPLKIKGEDWDKVLGAMQSAEVTAQPGKRKKHWLLLLLLLPLIVAVPFMYKNSNTQKPVTFSNTEKTDIATKEQNVGGAPNKNDKSINKGNKTTAQIAASSSSSTRQMNETIDNKKQNGSPLNKQFNIKTTAAINSRKDVSAGDINSNRK